MNSFALSFWLVSFKYSTRQCARIVGYTFRLLVNSIPTARPISIMGECGSANRRTAEVPYFFVRWSSMGSPSSGTFGFNKKGSHSNRIDDDATSTPIEATACCKCRKPIKQKGHTMSLTTRTTTREETLETLIEGNSNEKDKCKWLLWDLWLFSVALLYCTRSTVSG